MGLASGSGLGSGVAPESSPNKLAAQELISLNFSAVYSIASAVLFTAASYASPATVIPSNTGSKTTAAVS